jgi:N-acetylglutamate synthase-like GNAT family acetyltransferase
MISGEQGIPLAARPVVYIGYWKVIGMETSHQITTRRAVEQDTEQVMAFVRRIWDDDYVPNAWPYWIKDEKCILMVAEVDGKVGGMAAAYSNNGKETWMMGMRVDPDLRRLGVGTTLTNALLQEMWKSGLEVGRLAIEEWNQASQAMTQRAGFKLVQRYALLKADPDAVVEQYPEPRKATVDELGELMEAARESNRQQGAPLTAFSDWNWQEFTPESIKILISEGQVKVHPTLGTKAWVTHVQWDGDEREIGHTDWMFSAYGEPEPIIEILRGIYSRRAHSRNNDGEIEEFAMYVPHDAAYLPLLEQMGIRRHKAEQPAFDGYEYDGWQVYEYRKPE